MNTKSNEFCAYCIRKITWIGLCNSIILAVFKGIIGIFSRSHALIASALYSVHDIISSTAVLIGLKISTRPVDKKYPYGYGNVEYIISVFTSIILLMATIYLLYESVKTIISDRHVPPHWAALAAAVISIFSNEIIYGYNKCAFRHINSPAILSHATHIRADAISSAAVVLAILGSKLGIKFIDPLVAIFETGHLIITSAEILYHGSAGLMDHSISENDVNFIRNALSNVPDLEVKNIRSRQIGRNMWVELHIGFPRDRTIEELEKISGRIKKRLKNDIRYLGSVDIIYA